MKDDPLIEIVDRLARIETKLDNHEQLREKADIALSMAKNNEGDIAEIKRESKVDVANNCRNWGFCCCLFNHEILRRDLEMILPDKYYKIIKWGVLTVLPAGSVLVATLGKAYGWQETDMAVLTINAIATFLGVVTGVSAYNLKDKEK